MTPEREARMRLVYCKPPREDEPGFITDGRDLLAALDATRADLARLREAWLRVVALREESGLASHAGFGGASNRAETEADEIERAALADPSPDAWLAARDRAVAVKTLRSAAAAWRRHQPVDPYEAGVPHVARWLDSTAHAIESGREEPPR